MKRSLSLVALALFAISLIGCGSSNSGDEAPAPVDKAKDQSTQKTGAGASQTQD